MAISNVKGLSANAASVRQDAVIAGVPATPVRQRVFEARFAAAANNLAAATPRSTDRASISKRASVSESKASIASNQVTRERMPKDCRRDQRFVAAQEAQNSVRAPTQAQRLRQFRKTTPRYVRRKLFGLVEELGLTLVDLWSDVSGHAVTLVVQQDGWSETQFVIEHDKTTWRVAVHAAVEIDSDTLLNQGTDLQARFDAADLGVVVLGP